MAANTHQDRVLETLQNLRKYALETASPKGLEIGLSYHEEDSNLMRFANSAISLNTNEHLIRLEIVAYSGTKQASYELITDLSQLDEMKKGIDNAAELVEHAQPLNYKPTVPVYEESFSDDSGFDASLAQISNAERLAYFNRVASGLETEDVKLSGIFSSGSTIFAMIWTSSEHTQYFQLSDAQITSVLASEAQKWEVIAEASAQQKGDLDPTCLNRDLGLMIEQLKHEKPFQLPLGTYDIVFGAPATADMLSMMRWIGFNGGTMKRGYSFLNESQVGKKVLSDQFTLHDDPSLRETYPFKRDFYGIPRHDFPLFEQGVFQGFVWQQDDADEFGVQPTGHTVNHTSLVLKGGTKKGADSLVEIMSMSREKDLLYIPFLHYMNIVNPSKAILTGSSRFGTRLLRKDGSIGVPFNVRLTQSLLDVFGDNVAWMSEKTIAYNTSSSYGRRNPNAIVVPEFIRVNDLEISQSNPSY